MENIYEDNFEEYIIKLKMQMWIKIGLVYINASIKILNIQQENIPMLEKDLC